MAETPAGASDGDTAALQHFHFLPQGTQVNNKQLPPSLRSLMMSYFPNQ